MILVIDNYDSFVHNLARYIERLGQPTRVVRNDALSVSQIVEMRPSAIVLSPGPCTPAEAGCGLELVRRMAADTPILGVCLGHQTIAAALGGRVVRAKQPLHGRCSPVEHDGRHELEGIPSPFRACRYHSLIVERAGFPSQLEISAWSDEGEIMALRARGAPVVGLQFHPESILTQHGHRLLAGFLRVAGLPFQIPNPDELREPLEGPQPADQSSPATF